MKELRCTHSLPNGKSCNKKLGEFLHVEGTIVCPKCKKMNHITTSIESRRVPSEV